MNDSAPLADKAKLLAKLAPAGQQHLLAFWDRLDPSQRLDLARQVQELDLHLLAELRQRYGAGSDKSANLVSSWTEIANRAEGPPAIRLDGSGAKFTPDQARASGSAALQAGEVALMIVAGGLGTRLGFEHPKGMFELGPISRRSLFEILFDHLRGISNRYGVRIPIYLMTSPQTDGETRQFLAANDNFGLSTDDLHIFRQATMWAIDDRWERLLLETPGSIFTGPDGHGGMLSAFAASGCLQHAQSRGIKQLFYGQIDNPLLQVCDPLLLGSHQLAGSELTTQVVRKRDPLERVGNVVSVNGQLQMIEYSDLPSESAVRTNPDGSLKLWAGNLAVHVFDLAFLHRMSLQKDALPFHLAHKKVAYIAETGELVEPQKPNAIRFERFIFDLLPAAKNALVVEADPAEAFAPVKNSDDDKTDNPRLAKAAMIAQHTRWLQAAGVQVAPGTPVEINPRWALDAGEVAAKVSPKMRIDKPTYFGPDGPQT